MTKPDEDLQAKLEQEARERLAAMDDGEQLLALAAALSIFRVALLPYLMTMPEVVKTIGGSVFELADLIIAEQVKRGTAPVDRDPFFFARKVREN